MPLPHAYVDPSDSTQSNLLLILIGFGVVALACAVAMAPVLLVWSRRRRRPEALLVLALLWVILASASAIAAISAQSRWTREQTLRMKTGYYDPDDQTGAPGRPLGLWAGLGAAYGGLWAWAIVGVRQRGAPKAA